MPARPLPVSKTSTFVAGFLLFAGLVILNGFLVLPFIGWYDSGEMIGTTVCLGISHPSGQVLFHLLGKIFLLLPFSTPAFRLGLMSAACSALASVLFWVLSCRLAQMMMAGKIPQTPSPILKAWLFLLTLAWSFSVPWWRYSLMPLVYALHLLLGLLVLWALSLEKPTKWPLAFLFLGMATVFRPTQFFALPFVGLFFLWEWRKQETKKPKALLFALWGFALGRSTALYLPLRSALHPDIAYAELIHPLALVRHVLAMRFSHYVGAISVSSVFTVIQHMVSRYWSDLTPLGVILILWGCGVVWWKKEKIPAFLWAALGWGAVETIFVLTIPFPTFEPHQVLLSWVYSGWLAVLPLVFLEQFVRRGQYRMAKAGFSLILAVFFLLQLLGMGRQFENKKERGAQDYARNLLEIMEPNSVYYPAEENEYFPVVGYQQSFGFRKDVRVLEPGTNPAIVGTTIKECFEQNRTLYVTRQWALPPGWSFQGVGPLLKITHPIQAGIPKKVSVAAQPEALWGKIALMNAQITPSRVEPGGRIEITYQWARRGPSPYDETDSVVVLLADEQGNYWMRNGVFWLHDIHEGPLARLSLMKPGYEYEEKRILFIPSDFPAGKYHLVVGLQKPVPSREEGREAYGKEFYERSGSQNLDKFMGRGAGNAVVQFSAAMSGTLENGLWLVTKSSHKLIDSHFAPVAEIQILTRDESVHKN